MPTTRRPWLVPVAVFLFIWGLSTHGKYSVSGDEPHYLMVAHSLVTDGDLDVANNYAANDGRHFGHAGLVMDRHGRVAPSGATLPVHDVGLSVLVAPVYAAAAPLSRWMPEKALRRVRMSPGLFAYSLVSLALIAAVAMGARLLEVSFATGGLGPRAAAVAALVTALSPPVLSLSFLVFPEVPAFVVACLAVRLVHPPRALSYRTYLLAAVLFGLLPWFHRKFGLFAIGLAFVVAWHHRRALWALGARCLAGLAAAFLMPVAALVLWTVTYWGSVGGPLLLDRAPFSVDILKTGAVGLLFDREYGLLPWAPLYLLVPAAAWRRRREVWPFVVPALALFLPAAAHDLWWGGFSPAARFLMPLVPLAALTVAPLLARPAFRWAGLALLVPQSIVTAYAWQRPRALWPLGTGSHPVWPALPFGSAVESLFPSMAATGAAGAVPIVILVLLVAGALLFLDRRQPAAGDAAS
jgi:hypothetical protein